MTALSILTLFFVLCLFTSTVYSLLQPVSKLPGLSSSGYNPNLYSGYLSTSTYPCDVFSMLVLADESPEEKPFIVFSNGGPGASSLQGFIVENGPILLESDGKTLVPNPERWNRFANVLFMELPGAVGFSQSHITKWDDEMFAQTFFEALMKLQQQFPKLLSKNTPLYLAGESYASAYLIRTQYHILTNTTGMQLNYRGLFIGNGVTNNYYDTITPPLFMREHALVSESKYQSAYKTCDGDFSRDTKACQDALDGLWMSVFSAGINPYNLYDTCIPRNISNPEIMKSVSGHMRSGGRANMFHSVKQYLTGTHRTTFQGPGQPEPEPCVSIRQMEYFFNQPSVQKAIHVSDQPHHWTIVNQDLSQQYTWTNDVTEYFKTILEHKIPIVYFAGDTDLIVNAKGTYAAIEAFSKKLNLPQSTEWNGWKDRNGRNAGFQIGWSLKGTEIRLVTVRGGGHMAASNRARQVVDLLVRYIQETKK